MASDELPAGWVRLNVGGKNFVTMKQTLRSSPFFARLLENDDRMPDAKAGSPTHFVDRNADRFAQVLDFLRDGELSADKHCNLEDLRREANFYGLGKLVTAIYERKARNESDVEAVLHALENLAKSVVKTKERNELHSTTKCVVVSRKNGCKSIEIAVGPRDDDHFLLRHLKLHYPCGVSAPRFLFPYGFAFELKECSLRAHFTCTARTAEAMLQDVASSLEQSGYVLNQSVEEAISAAGRSATSWTFIKREG